MLHLEETRCQLWINIGGMKPRNSGPYNKTSTEPVQMGYKTQKVSRPRVDVQASFHWSFKEFDYKKKFNLGSYNKMCFSCLCLRYILTSPQQCKQYSYVAKVLIRSTVRFTKLNSRLQIHRISVRFYEMGVSKTHNCFQSLCPISVVYVNNEATKCTFTNKLIFKW